MTNNLRKIVYNQYDNLILFGGSYLLVELLESLENQKKSVFVFSSTRHLDEKTKNHKTLRDFLKERKFVFFESDDINTDTNLRKVTNKNSLGISLGAAWIFEKSTVGLFAPGRLLDFMGIDLPKYRGGAHYTWKILHDNRNSAANLQVILGGESTFHLGPIVESKKISLPKQARIPSEYFDYLSRKESEFILTFLEDARKGRTFVPKYLDESKSSHYPFLSTEDQALIDWSWSGKEICTFIHAFDDPYKGASTFLGERKIFLKKCSLLKEEEKYHKFTSGIVTRKGEGSIYVASVGNLLRIREVTDSNGENVISEVGLGARFYTPHDALDASRKFCAEYGSKGLKKKKKYE